MTAKDLARAALIDAEGISLTPYRDTLGYWTIGRGHKLPQDLPLAELKAMRWTLDEADAQFDRDLNTAWVQAQSFDWFVGLTAARKAVIVEMVYQLGLGGVRKFVKMIAAIKARDWDEAARQIRQSKAGQEQTPRRYRRLATVMRRGTV